MNNKLKYLGLALTALLAACSADEELQEARGVDNNTPAPEVIQAALQPSDQEITFGSITGTATLTRAAVDNINGFIDDIGVFCLSSEILTDNNGNVLGNSPADVSWLSTTAAYNLNAWLWNEPAKIGYDNVDDEYKIQFTSGSKFYPQGKWYKYDFLAIYPRTDSVVQKNINAGVFTTDNWRNVWAIYDFDGTQDIMVASSYEADDQSDAFYDQRWSAYYYNAGGTASPKLEFQHQLARLNFKVKAVDNAAYQNLTNQLGLKVDSIIITNVPYVLAVKVANYGAAGYPAVPPVGNIMCLKGPDGKMRKNMYLRAADGSSLRTIGDQGVITTEGTTLGGACMMVYPENATNYQLKVFLGKTEGNVHTVYQVGGFVDLPKPDNGWEKGKEYTIEIVLNSPQEIEAVVSYQNWNDGGIRTVEY